MSFSRSIAIGFVVFHLLFCASACTKSKSVSPATGTDCQIAGIMLYDDDTTNAQQYYFYYDDTGNLTKITYVMHRTQDYDVLFSYHHSNTIVTSIYVGEPSPFERDTLVFDNSNRVNYIGNFRSGEPGWDKFLYDSANGMYQHQYYSINRSYIYVDTFSWLNGDIVRYSRDYRYNYTYNSTYYTYYDTLYKTGKSTASIFDLIHYGRTTFNSQHLVKKISTLSDYYSPTPDTILTYKFDVNGNITDINRSPMGTNSETKIVYSCK